MKKMSKADRLAWASKTERLNADHDIAVGDRVQDLFLREGIVERIDPADPENSLEAHGTVEVLLGDGEREHYTHAAWRTQLRRLA